MIHELKCWPDSFQATAEGRKTHEVRRNDDRRFAAGDRLYLREWIPENGAGDGRSYTGRVLSVEVTYITGGGTFGLPSDVDVLSIKKV
jgi:hypothetical protein